MKRFSVWFFKAALVMAVLLAVLATFAPEMRAAVINVTPGGSIQTAINSAVDGDVIIVAAGTYTEDIDFFGKAITVKSTNPDNPAATIISGNTAGRVVNFANREKSNSILLGFTIDSDMHYGVYCEQSSPTINKCIITHSFLAGIYCNYASPTITNCQIMDTYYYGIYCQYSQGITINNSTISHSYIQDGIYCQYSSLTITNTSIIDNGSDGIYAEYSTLTVINSTINDHRGDGIDVNEYCLLTIDQCTINNNEDEGIFLGWACLGTITNCTISGNYGEGIDIYLSSVTIDHCTIINNMEYGLTIGESFFTITNCTISGNENDGIDIDYVASGTIDQSTISDNYEDGIEIDESTVAITNCTIIGNSNDGIYFDESSITIDHCTISGNEIDSYDSLVNITNSTIKDNHLTGLTVDCSLFTIAHCTISGSGYEGIYIDESSGTIDHCLITNNQDDGIYCGEESSAMINNCTVSGNGYEGLEGYDAWLYVINSIFWGNNTHPDSSGYFDIIHYNPHCPDPTVIYCDVQNVEGVYPGLGNINQDPDFGADYLLNPGSPCIDSGHPRIKDSDLTRSDMGVYGGGGSTDPLNKIVDSSGGGDYLTIQAAIDDLDNLNPIPGDTITVLPGLTGRYTENIVIEGPKRCISLIGQGDVTIDGGDAGPVIIIDNVGSGITLKGFIITNGKDYGDNDYDGGGISCEYSALVITNCSLIDNESDEAGGGIYAYFATLDIDQTTISNNSAYRQNSNTYDGFTYTYTRGIGGGIYSEDARVKISNSTISANLTTCGGGIYHEYGPLSLANCNITDNTAIGYDSSTNPSNPTRFHGDGGGITCCEGPLNINNCRISDNETADEGGGISAYECFGTISNSIISHNEATAGDRGDGGGIYFDYYVMTITNCQISENSAVEEGGGVSGYGICKVINSTISNNLAGDEWEDGEDYEYCGDGGGIFWDHFLIITDSTVSGNTATYGGGGGIFSYDALMMKNCTITGNTAGCCGGGIYGDGYSLIEGSTIAGNMAGDEWEGGYWGAGGGIYSEKEFLLLKDSTITGNTSLYDGGGMYIEKEGLVTNCLINDNTAIVGGGIYANDELFINDELIIVNSTLTGNTAEYGGGIYSNRGEDLYVTNCILWHDTLNEIYTEEGDEGQVNYTDIEGGYAGVGNFSLDPLFKNPAAGDYHLKTLSPCIDKGTWGHGVPTRDRDGKLRGRKPDLGAYEYPPGDLDGDGDVDFADRAILFSALGARRGNVRFVEKADYNGDGYITYTDYQLWYMFYKDFNGL